MNKNQSLWHPELNIDVIVESVDGVNEYKFSLVMDGSVVKEMYIQINNCSHIDMAAQIDTWANQVVYNKIFGMGN